MNKKIITLLNEYRLSRNNINSYSTIKGEKSYVNIISTCLNELKIKTVADLKYTSYNDIVGWFRTNTKSKNSSINKYTSYLKAMLRYFKFNSHPFLLSKKLGDDSSHVIPYHEKDLIEIFRYLRDLNVNANSFTYYALFKLQYATGARVTELLRTKIKIVDLKSRSIL